MTDLLLSMGEVARFVVLCGVAAGGLLLVAGATAVVSWTRRRWR